MGNNAMEFPPPLVPAQAKIIIFKCVENVKLDQNTGWKWMIS